MNDLNLPNRPDLIAIEIEARRLRNAAFRAAVAGAWRWLTGLLAPAGRPATR